mmetsp:Transcript_12141/g.19554  ORF Transcript_12141/g.19554 Transcript_12141/m.19554 type:complete len:86 (+) Transcript_12141:135-392(+)
MPWRPMVSSSTRSNRVLSWTTNPSPTKRTTYRSLMRRPSEKVHVLQYGYSGYEDEGCLADRKVRDDAMVVGDSTITAHLSLDCWI